jgi:hypothetical protein
MLVREEFLNITITYPLQLSRLTMIWSLQDTCILQHGMYRGEFRTTYLPLYVEHVILCSVPQLEFRMACKELFFKAELKFYTTIYVDVSLHSSDAGMGQ